MVVQEQAILKAVGATNATEFTKEWPLVDRPGVVGAMMVVYLILIRLGEAWMRNREAFKLRNYMIVHNFGLVILSTYTTWKLLSGFFLRQMPDDLLCEMPNANTAGHMQMAEGMFLFFISKQIDLLDTALLVLKKKPVSVLHWYHHVSVLFLGWVLIRYLPSGTSMMGPTANSIVHMVMYTYYGLAAIGPHMQKYLWWKKYLTKLQLSQFVFIAGYTFIPWVRSNTCTYPKFWILLQTLYVISLFVLFVNFYYQTYIKRARAKVRTSHGDKAVQNGKSNGVDKNSSYVQNGKAHNE